MGNEGRLTIKTVQKGKFPVIGFVKDSTGVAALYLGKREGKDLVAWGKVGTGWSRTVSSQIRKQLDTRRESEIQADEADQEAEGHMGRADLLRGRGVPGHHVGRSVTARLVQGPQAELMHRRQTRPCAN
jgi:hypothetical protein